MSKIVLLTKNVEKGIKIRNFMSGGKKFEDVIIWEDDVLNDFSYLENDEIETINGRLCNTIFSFNTKGSCSKTEPNKIANLAKVGSVIIDASEQYKSVLKMICKPNILEYKASGAVDDVDVIPMVRVKLHLVMSDKAEIDLVLEEGMDLYSAIFKAANTPAIVYGDFNIDGFIYQISSNNAFDVTGLILKNDEGKTYKVDFSIIKNFGKKGIVIDSTTENIATKIKEADADENIAGVSLQGKTSIDEEIEFNGTLDIHSINATVPAYSGSRKTDDIDEDEDVIKNALICKKGSALAIEGCALTDKASIVTDEAKELDLSNSKFVNIEPTEASSYLVRGNGFKDASTLLVVDGCYFGNNKKDEGKKIVNVLECNMKLANGSKIENLYFAKDACEGRGINICDVEDGATIAIDNVHFEDVNKGIHISVIGEPNCNIYINDITYDVLDENSEENTPVIDIQPYGNQTTSFKNMTVNITNVKGINRDSLTFRLHSESGDMELTEENKPKIYVNGILQK